MKPPKAQERTKEIIAPVEGAHRGLSKGARPQVVPTEMVIVRKTGSVAKLKCLGA
jgi:hypothetical protein